MFEHRLGALLGLTLDQILSLGESELKRWRRYWIEEPWGPYRDNLHMAIMTAELLRPHVRDPKALEYGLFMLEPEHQRRERAALKASAFMEAAAASARRRASKGKKP